MKKRVTNELKLKLMILVGILLRLYYIIATPIVQNRQYDLGSAVPSEGIFTGHLGYIFYLFTYKGLPDFDPREVYQFFHPPLHHTISALWMGIVSIFTDNMNVWMEWLQVLPFIYSVIIILVIWQICKEFHLQGLALNLVMAIVIFHPSLIFMSGSINNDCLSLLFQFLTLLTALRWYRNRTYPNIIAIALSISLGMITKLSVGMFAIPVAFLFLYVILTEWKQRGKNWGSFPVSRFLQYLAFGAVCIPIGLSWALRCLIRFDMPLTYVNALPVNSWQYVGNYTMWERFFIPNPIKLLRNLSQGSLGFGENVWMQLFRTSALGECDLTTFPMWGKVIAMLMMAVAGLLAIWAFGLFVSNIYKGRFQVGNFDMGKGCFWIIGYLVLFISYLNFCYNFPHQCTMNFRYMVPTILFPAVSMGVSVHRSNKTLWIKVLGGVIGIYVILSILTTIVWSVTV